MEDFNAISAKRQEIEAVLLSDQNQSSSFMKNLRDSNLKKLKRVANSSLENLDEKVMILRFEIFYDFY